MVMSDHSLILMAVMIPDDDNPQVSLSMLACFALNMCMINMKNSC